MVNYSNIPVVYMKEGLQLWVEKGIRPGSFMSSMLANDFINAALRADATNLQNLQEWARFIYNELPPDCWGSWETLKEWEKKNGR